MFRIFSTYSFFVKIYMHKKKMNGVGKVEILKTRIEINSIQLCFRLGALNFGPCATSNLSFVNNHQYSAVTSKAISL